MAPEPELTVYFDGGCPACSREITIYRRRETAGRVAWVDLWNAGDALAAHGIRMEDAMQYLHAIGRDGTRYVGVGAFVEIWRRVPGFGAAAFAVNLPVVRSIAAAAYRAFARHVRLRLPRRCALNPAQSEETSWPRTPCGRSPAAPAAHPFRPQPPSSAVPD